MRRECGDLPRIGRKLKRNTTTHKIKELIGICTWCTCRLNLTSKCQASIYGYNSAPPAHICAMKTAMLFRYGWMHCTIKINLGHLLGSTNRQTQFKENSKCSSRTCKCQIECDNTFLWLFTFFEFIEMINHPKGNRKKWILWIYAIANWSFI